MFTRPLCFLLGKVCSQSTHCDDRKWLWEEFCSAESLKTTGDFRVAQEEITITQIAVLP